MGAASLFQLLKSPASETCLGIDRVGVKVKVTSHRLLAATRVADVVAEDVPEPEFLSAAFAGTLVAEMEDGSCPGLCVVGR